MGGETFLGGRKAFLSGKKTFLGGEKTFPGGRKAFLDERKGFLGGRFSHLLRELLREKILLKKSQLLCLSFPQKMFAYS